MDKLKDLKTLYLAELKDLYDAEHQLTDALPKMADKASDDGLKQAFRSHLKETEGHVVRLERVFEMLGRDGEAGDLQGDEGRLVAEGEEVIKAKGESDVVDAALIGAAQRVEHYEMAGYGTVRALARSARHHKNQATLLDQTLTEEKAADEQLNTRRSSASTLRPSPPDAT